MARIIVVDDEVSIRSVLRKLLEAEGHEILEAEHGGVAVRLYEESPADLVITDIVMPEHEGMETIFKLRKKNPRPKILVISGRDEEWLQIAQKLGADAALKKPFTGEQMLNAVRTLLQQ